MEARKKAMLVGMYLSKFDREGMRLLGFRTFNEACNVMGTALAIAPGSIKNYRDEFDSALSPLRKGWRNRPMRPACKALLDVYGDKELPEFMELLKNAIYRNPEIDRVIEQTEAELGGDSSFARRLLTGQAAEEYFRGNYRRVHEFAPLTLQDTTGFGCGFDFRLFDDNRSYGVEVKGLSKPSGSIVMTDREYSVAGLMRDRFFLFVVKNMAESPMYEIHRNPIGGDLVFKCTERRIASWTTTID